MIHGNKDALGTGQQGPSRHHAFTILPGMAQVAEVPFSSTCSVLEREVNVGARIMAKKNKRKKN